MPVDVLIVEGELDEQVLFPLKPAGLTLVRGDSKGSLAPKARDRRRQQNVRACYLRDRDFDFDPPADLGAPTVDAHDRQESPATVLGWRWCRHAIEGYLLEPGLVEAATGWPQAEYERQLLAAAAHIRHYTAARWAVGIARRSLPPMSELATRPALTNEIKLPADCGEAGCDAWAHAHVASFLAQIDQTLTPAAVAVSLADKKALLAGLTSPQEVLLWHSGKDLLAALAPALPARFKNQPVVFLRTLRDWVRDNSAPALALFPEWQALLQALKAP